MEVYDPSTGDTVLFPCDKWLQASGASKEGCQVRLLANAPLEGSSEVEYEVVVTTSDIRTAGTDANILCTIIGDKGDTGPRPLESSSNDFERGSVCVFFIKALNVGSLQCLQVRCSDIVFKIETKKIWTL